MARGQILAKTRTPASARAVSAALAVSPRARLFTTFGTVIYVDGAQLIHGPIESSPANAFFVEDPSWVGSHRRGCLVHDRAGKREPIACSTSHCVLASRVEGKDGSSVQSVLEVVPLGRGLIAFTAGDLFLCAEPDGRITLSRTVCSSWECFMASENLCADDPDGFLLQGPADERMKIDRSAIENFIIPDLLRTQIDLSAASREQPEEGQHSAVVKGAIGSGVVAEESPITAHPRDISPADLSAAMASAARPDLLKQLVDISRRIFGFFASNSFASIWYPWVARTLEYLPKGTRILDIGAGLSPLPVFLAEKGFVVECIDPHRLKRVPPPSADWNEWGFFDYGRVHPNLRSYHCAIADFPSSGRFDVIYSVGVLAHVPRKIS